VFETGSQVKFEVNLKEQFDPLNTPVELSAIQVKIALAASATKLTSCQQKVNI
jgi:hypothetical protein